MSNSEESNSLDGRSPFVRTLLRLARSRTLGLTLALVAVVFVGYQWSGTDFASIDAVPHLSLLASGFAYAVALLALALAPFAIHRAERMLAASGLIAQLLKYIPGSVWQSQGLYSRGGGSAVVSYAITGAAGAGVALAFGASFPFALVGVSVLVVSLMAGIRLMDLHSTLVLTLFGCVVALGVGVSGGILGAAVGLDFFHSMREIGAAWGLGVVAIPVPAGLGVREFYISVVSTSSDLVELGILHRLVTFVTDVVVGLIGLAVLARSPR